MTFPHKLPVIKQPLLRIHSTVPWGGFVSYNYQVAPKPNITQSPSPNYGARAGYKPEIIVVHCTDGHYPSDLAYLRNPDPGGVVGPVSAHFLIAPSGEIHQLVQTDFSAWHAGRVLNPTAKLKKGVNPNLYSIGIEVSLVSTDKASKAQTTSLKALIAYLGETHHIPLDREHVIGHREIYAAKTCPGTIDVSSLLPVKEPEIVEAVIVPPPAPPPAPAPRKLSTAELVLSILKKIFNL